MADYTTAPPGQDGYASVGIWADSDDTLVSFNNVIEAEIGLVFEASGAEIASGSVALRVAATSQTPALAPIQLWFVPDVAPADYGPSALPGARAELLIGEILYTGQPAGTVLELVLGETYNAAHQLQIDAALSQLRTITGMASWSGRLAFTVKALTTALMHFESAETPGGAAPMLSVVELAPSQEASSLALVAKQIRKTLVSRLNSATDSPELAALSIVFEDGVWPDVMGRAIAALARGHKRGFIATHPETAPDGKQPNLRVLELHLIVVAGSKDIRESADTLDDAQEAVEFGMERDPMIGGLAPAGAVFTRAQPGVDGNGERVFGIRWITYTAQYARRRKA